MKQVDAWTLWGLLVLALIASPAVLILAVPMAIGFGLDVFDLGGETAIVAALCAPLAIAALREMGGAATLRRVVGGLWTRLHLEQAAHLIHAR